MTREELLGEMLLERFAPLIKAIETIAEDELRLNRRRALCQALDGGYIDDGPARDNAPTNVIPLRKAS